jgi:hypothetical protein
MNAAAVQGMKPKPVIVPNSFQTPNAHVDDVMQYLTGDEFKVLNFATRHILGWQDSLKKKSHCISLTMFEHGFLTQDGRHFGGTGLSRPTIVKCLAQLVTYGLLVAIGDPGPDGQCYGLGESPDVAALQSRKAGKKSNARQKMAPVRARRQVAAAGQSHLPVNDINHPSDPVNAINQKELMPLTDPGQWHLLNQTHINTLETHSSFAPDGAHTNADPQPPAIAAESSDASGSSIIREESIPDVSAAQTPVLPDASAPADEPPAYDVSHQDMMNAIVSAFEWEPEDIAKGKWGEIAKASKDLRKLRVALDEVAILHTYCARKFDSFGPNALAKWTADCRRDLRNGTFNPYEDENEDASAPWHEVFRPDADEETGPGQYYDAVQRNMQFLLARMSPGKDHGHG